jgi:hypothetical protein
MFWNPREVLKFLSSWVFWAFPEGREDAALEGKGSVLLQD